MLHTPTLNQCPYQVSNSDTLWFPRYHRPSQSFKGQRSNQDVAHLQPPNQYPFQVSSFYTLQDFKDQGHNGKV